MAVYETGAWRPVKPAPAKPKRDELAAPTAAAVLLGAAMGALGALAFAAIEAALVAWLGLDLPAPDLYQPLLASYAVTGAVLGAAGGLTGYVGARWAVVTALLAAAWLGSGGLGGAFVEAGTTGWGSPLFALPSALAVGWLVGQVIPQGNYVLAVAAGLFTWLAVAAPLNVHLLGDPFSALSLLVDGVVVLIAVAVGALAAALGGDGGVPRTALGIVALGAAGAGLAYAGWRPPTPPVWPQATADGKPPIVLVVVDGLRADRVGTGGAGAASGKSESKTPSIDALAARGVLYADATAAAPWTLPAVASIETGRPPSRHGAGVNAGDHNLYTPLRADVPTVATVLHGAGYATALVASNPWLVPGYGLQHGFDAAVVRTGPSALPMSLYTLHRLGVDPVAWPAHEPAETVVDRAVAFVHAQTHRQWFLMVHLSDLDVPADAYDAAVTSVDAQIGRLAAELPKDAVVAVVGAEGASLGEGRRQTAGVPAGARDGWLVYQEDVHVPLVVVAPGVRPQVSSRPVSVLDVVPTLEALAGFLAPEQAPSALPASPSAASASGALPSSYPLVEVVGGAAPAERLIVAEGSRWGVEHKLARIGDYALIVASNNELYDLSRDPIEGHPLIDTTSEALTWSKRLHAAVPPAVSSDVAEEASLSSQLGDLVVRVHRLRAASVGQLVGADVTSDGVTPAPGSPPSPAPSSP